MRLWLLATIGLVLGFRSSSALAAAYGIAVTSTMVITSMLAYLVARGSWGVPRVVAGSIAAFFLIIELAFFGANLTKVLHGGWFPLVIGAVIYTAFSTWKRGRALLGPVLAGLVGPPLIERTDLEQMLAAERPPPEPSGLSPEDERALIRQTLEDHYWHILDQPIPSLGGKSPRAAAKSPKGREKVVAWLKTLENHSAKRPAGDPIGEYDFGWMWRELGVEALRH